MRRQLLDLFQVFTYGLLCVSIIGVSLWFATTSESFTDLTAEIPFEKIDINHSTSYLDFENVFVSENSTSGLFSQEKSKNQTGESSSIFGYRSISFYQSFFVTIIYREPKFGSLLDQLHNILFFF
ncbi:hypothetical protein [Aquiflexum lacus]|uniref:hypothetical protein n=1 Tax=Aquiflexum lacus TaxID=2483805 RepID=UPI001892F1A3|nr:hypothetical protein [Aquiflexum lacus]